jgi:hypothetical protein
MKVHRRVLFFSLLVPTTIRQVAGVSERTEGKNRNGKSFMSYKKMHDGLMERFLSHFPVRGVVKPPQQTTRHRPTALKAGVRAKFHDKITSPKFNSACYGQSLRDLIFSLCAEKLFHQ